MVKDIVNSVLSDNSNRRIAVQTNNPAVEIKKLAVQKNRRKRTNTPNKSALSTTKGEKVSTALPSDDLIIGKACPLCGKGIIIKGKTAYGCSEWRKGCDWRLPFKS
jgi:DNA topoisomerase-3